MDGSAFAWHAVQRALGLVQVDVKKTLVMVARPFVFDALDAAAVTDVAPVITEPLPEDVMVSRIQDAEAELAQTAQTLGLNADETMVVIGDPGPALCRLAGEANYDFVVVGSHGSGLLKRVLVGRSVTTSCATPPVRCRRSPPADQGGVVRRRAADTTTWAAPAAARSPTASSVHPSCRSLLGPRREVPMTHLEQANSPGEHGGQGAPARSATTVLPPSRRIGSQAPVGVGRQHLGRDGTSEHAYVGLQALDQGGAVEPHQSRGETAMPDPSRRW